MIAFGLQAIPRATGAAGADMVRRLLAFAGLRPAGGWFPQALGRRRAPPAGNARRLPCPLPIGADLPPGAEWHWRPGFLCGRVDPVAVTGPDNGHRLGPDATLWYDCPLAGLSLRQIRSGGGIDRHALQVETAGFAGSFLSLAIDLPAAGLHHLTDRHILQLDGCIDARRPVGLSARLNLVQGPNTETAQRDLAGWVGGPCRLAFDLAYAGLSDRPVDRAWLDLIVAAPNENAFVIRDLRLAARWRAQI